MSFTHAVRNTISAAFSHYSLVPHLFSRSSARQRTVVEVGVGSSKRSIHRLSLGSCFRAQTNHKCTQTFCSDCKQPGRRPPGSKITNLTLGRCLRSRTGTSRGHLFPQLPDIDRPHPRSYHLTCGPEPRGCGLILGGGFGVG